MTDSTSEIARGRRILVVEDEYFIAEEIRVALERMGAIVLGPVATVDAALAVIASEEVIDGVTLDVALRGVKSYPVAEMLLEKGIPFVLLTGYVEQSLPEHLRGMRRCQKPVKAEKVIRALID